MSDGKPLLPEGSPFELWDVRLMSGDLKLSIDELDAAFESGLVDRNTLVRRRGTVRWVTLAEAAGLDASDEAPATTPDPMPPPPAVPRPAPRRTTPPPLPPSVIVPPPPALIVETPPAPHVSSLPPPMTISTALEDVPPKEPSKGDALDDTAAAIAALHPRSSRKRVFAAFVVLALAGAAATIAVKFPSVGHTIAAKLHRTPAEPSANGVAVAAPPPAASAVPSPVPTPSSAASAPAVPSTSSSMVKAHAPPANSSGKPVTGPAKPARATRSGTNPAVVRH